MSVIADLFNRGSRARRPATASGPPPWDDYWYSNPVANATGVDVTPELAQQVTAVMGCVRILAEGVAQLPLKMYSNRADGGKDVAPTHPLYQLLHSQPNKWQTSFEWREMMMGHLCLRGNAYSEIIAGPRGSVDVLIPRHPDNISIKQAEGGSYFYEHRLNGLGPPRRILSDRMFHVRWFSNDGIKGLTPIALAAQPIGLALALEKYAASLFKNRLLHGGVLQHPGKLSEPAHANLRRSMTERHAGLDNAHTHMILEEGMQWQSIGMNAADAQMLESRKYQVADIARLYRVPPHMIGDLERATFSNIEQQSLEFVIYSLGPWLIRWEQRISADLITYPDRYFAEFSVDGLLRGDIASRYAAYATGVQNGWLTINEVRALENMNPLPLAGGLVQRGADDDQGEAIGLAGGGMSTETVATDTEWTVTGLVNGEPVSETVIADPGIEPSGQPGTGAADQDDPCARQASTLVEMPFTASGAVGALRVLIEDAVGRIVAAELRELDRHVARANEDRERWAAWVAKFYGGHAEYVAKCLSPTARAWTSLAGKEFDLDDAFLLLVEAPREQLIAAEDPAALVAAWHEGRPAALVETLVDDLVIAAHYGDS